MRTVSKGILANKIVGFYLTDSTTTFGNSGGGLYNKKGELIGIPSNVLGYAGGLDKEGKVTFVPESSLGLSRDLPTIKAFLEGVEY
jgi:S1-C subfamily serine protease